MKFNRIRWAATFFALATIAIFCFFACQKEEQTFVEPYDTPKHSKELTITNTDRDATFTVEIASDYEELVYLYDAQSIEAEIMDTPENDSDMADQTTSGEPNLSEYADYRRVFIKVKHISSAKAFNSYSLTFSQVLREKLKEQKVSVVIQFAQEGDEGVYDREQWWYGSARSVKMLGYGYKSYVEVWPDLGSPRYGELYTCLTSKISNWGYSCTGQRRIIAVHQYAGYALRQVLGYSTCSGAQCN